MPLRQKASPARDASIFGEQAIDFSALLALDADSDLTVGTLVLPEGRKLENVHVQFSVRDGKLDAPLLQASVLGGTARGRLSIDATRAHDPALALHLDAKDMDLGALLQALHVPREVRGGKTELNLDVTTRGESPRAWARDASGTVLMVTGPATLVHTDRDLDSALNKLAKAINPFYKVDPSTELECAVIRLPLKDGVAQIDHSIALETAKFGATAVGTLDFRNETLELAIRPQVRHGIRIDVPQVASLVRFEGPFRSPAVHIDAAGSVAAVAKVGAAIYSGGLSLVGESLLTAANDGGAGPCSVALGQSGPDASASSSPSSTPQSKAASTPTPIGKDTRADAGPIVQHRARQDAMLCCCHWIGWRMPAFHLRHFVLAALFLAALPLRAAGDDDFTLRPLPSVGAGGRPTQISSTCSVLPRAGRARSRGPTTRPGRRRRFPARATPLRRLPREPRSGPPYAACNSATRARPPSHPIPKSTESRTFRTSSDGLIWAAASWAIRAPSTIPPAVLPMRWSTPTSPCRSISLASGATMDRVATHEWGHALGLGHSNLDGQVMSGTPDSQYNSLTDLQPDDIRGCRCLYGMPAGAKAGIYLLAAAERRFRNGRCGNDVRFADDRGQQRWQRAPLARQLFDDGSGVLAAAGVQSRNDIESRQQLHADDGGSTVDPGLAYG